MELQFCKSRIPGLAKQFCEHFEKRFPKQAEREQKLIDMRDEVSEQKYLTKNILRETATWKSKRRVALIEDNSENDVREITGYALQSENERVIWGVLTCLAGVGFPTATVILHFFHKDPYPILDWRAAESVGEKETYNYSLEFWQKYVTFCRNHAKSDTVEMPTFDQMRTLDRALWWNSKKDDEK